MAPTAIRSSPQSARHGHTPLPHVPLRERRATLRCPVCRFRETTFELLGGVKELNFNKLNLGDDEAVQLAVVLPLCAKLTKLKLMSTQVGDKGAAALAGAIKGNGVVKKLLLDNNHIGDPGAAAFSDALRINGVLETLLLNENKIGDAGGAALADALRVNGALQTLELYSNQIGDAGAAAVADALRVNSALKELKLHNNQIGDRTRAPPPSPTPSASTALCRRWFWSASRSAWTPSPSCERRCRGGQACSSFCSRGGGAYWSPPIARDGARLTHGVPVPFRFICDRQTEAGGKA